MRIGIYGAGAVGGYYGAMLARAGENVTFIVREKRAQQLRQRGLVVHSVVGNFTIQPTLVTDVRNIDKLDIVIVAIKNYHLADAMDDLTVLHGAGTVIVPLLNGVRHMDHLLSEFGEKDTLGGSCYIETTLSKEGDILQTGGSCEIVYGPVNDVTIDDSVKNLMHQMQGIFTKAGIKALYRHQILVQMWKKYVFLCALSGVTAACRLPIGSVLQEPKGMLLYSDMIRELLSVAHAKGVALPENLHDQMMESAAKLDPALTSSMHRDLEKGLPLELDSLQGALIEMAMELGIHVPVHEVIYAVLAAHRFGKR